MCADCACIHFCFTQYARADDLLLADLFVSACMLSPMLHRARAACGMGARRRLPVHAAAGQPVPRGPVGPEPSQQSSSTQRQQQP